MDNWERYEAEKRRLQELNMPWWEYEQRLRELLKQLEL